VITQHKREVTLWQAKSVTFLPFFLGLSGSEAVASSFTASSAEPAASAVSALEPAASSSAAGASSVLASSVTCETTRYHRYALQHLVLKLDRD